MRTKVVLTVDTEPSIAGAYEDPERNTPLLHEPVAGEVAGKSEALGFLVETLSQYGQCATFFVEALHTRYFPAHAMGRYVERLMAAGQDVQLHLHPTWLNFRDGEMQSNSRISDNCGELDRDLLAKTMEEGAAQIESWTGRRPTALRTGNFSTSQRVFEAMAEVGLSASSNICLAVAPPKEPELALAGGRHDIEGVRELPVTCFVDRGPVGRGRLRPLQVTALGAGEMIALLKQLHEDGGEEDPGVAVIVTHPFEFIKSRDFRYSRMKANALVQGRLKRLCAFLAEESDKFEVVPLQEAATQAPGSNGATPPIPEGNPLRAFVRAGENYLNDRLP